MGGRVLLAGLALAAAAQSGCTTHQCDASTGHFTGGDVLIADDTAYYETTPLADPKERWVAFNGQETLVVDYPPQVRQQLAGFQFETVGSMVGISDQPNDDASNFTTGAGQLSLYDDVITTPANAGFTVMNTTCTNYNVRVVLIYARSSTGASDAGIPPGVVTPADAAEQ